MVILCHWFLKCAPEKGGGGGGGSSLSPSAEGKCPKVPVNGGQKLLGTWQAQRHVTHVEVLHVVTALHVLSHIALACTHSECTVIHMGTDIHTSMFCYSCCNDTCTFLVPTLSILYSSIFCVLYLIYCRCIPYQQLCSVYPSTCTCSPELPTPRSCENRNMPVVLGACMSYMIQL